jgi:hypothetical protein
MVALNNACKDLNAGAFKLWIYLAKQRDGHTFALSPTALKNNFDMGKTQYDNARNELVSKGYLVIERGNFYLFHEVPIKQTEEERIKRHVEESLWLEERNEINKINRELIKKQELYNKKKAEIDSSLF